jgi:DNA topoisomerase IB
MLQPLTPEAAAREAGLRYVTDAGPGIRRQRSGTGFSYRLPDGSLLRDAAMLKRLRSLAIPPAWQQVWICPRDDGHIQATGRDARDRKQYIYHPEFRPPAAMRATASSISITRNSAAYAKAANTPPCRASRGCCRRSARRSPPTWH